MSDTTLKQQIVRTTARFRYAVRKRVAPGFRLPLGVLLIAGGILGFLPILGFWMIPLGVAIAALDVGPLWRYATRRGREKDTKR